MKDMQAQLEKEGKEDTEVYEKVTCWCETNDKGKTVWGWNDLRSLNCARCCVTSDTHPVTPLCKNWSRKSTTTATELSTLMKRAPASSNQPRARPPAAP